MKAGELRDMSDRDLQDHLQTARRELFGLRFQHATNQLTNPGKIADVKKDIARVKTIIREKQTASAGR